MIHLDGRTALVTGGSRGIGAATAIMLAEAGADVAILYRSKSGAAVKVARRIEQAGRRSLVLRSDITRLAECRAAVGELSKKWGKIDILVNSAGTWRENEITSLTSKELRKEIDTNLTGVFNICMCVAPIMKSMRRGAIINVASTAGQRGEAFHSPYAAAKGGVIALTKSLAIELVKFGIRVNCVAPGWVETDMIARVTGSPGKKREVIASIPRGKIADPDEIAGPIVFLASDLATNIIGEILNVNGGSVLCG